MNRREALALLIAISGMPLTSLAQQPARVRRIAFLGVRARSTPENPEVYYDAFVSAMRDLGYVEGKNLAVEWRFAEGRMERLPDLAAEVVRLSPEVIVTHGTPSPMALKRLTSTIPIVTAGTNDPIASGLIESLARPGGNLTGTSIVATDVGGKGLEFLKLLLPKLSHVAVLINPNVATHSKFVDSIQVPAQQLGVKVMSLKAANLKEIESSFALMARERIEAVLVVTDSVFIGFRRQFGELAIKHRILSAYQLREHVEAGGLLCYGQNLSDGFTRAATYVDKILKGARPQDLPVEQPTKIELVLNRKTATALGLKIPMELLLRADRVIE